MVEDAFGIVGSVIASAYHVESAVAEGGFGTVYRAHHGGFRAAVALKCLRMPPGLSTEGQQYFLDSFRSEAELLFRLSASIPTVVRPLHVDAFTAADGRFVPYMVLEWLEGDTLDALIRRRRADGQAPYPLKKLIRLLTPVARALERAHNFHGQDGPISVVHRDLKPENIFVANVAGEELVKILDFGVGKAKSLASQVAGRASQDTAELTSFTPAYGSPEQWAPKHFGQTGPWTDVWGLALTLTEALVGKAVIEGDPAAMMGTILDPQLRPTPGSEGVIVSDEVEAVFSRALALDPRDRHSDAGVFWNELMAAARVTSGEMGEVRLQRDARAEPGGGVRVERVEVARRPSVRPSAAPRSLASERAPAAASAAPGIRSSPPFASPAAVRSSSAISGSFNVPDLELSPVSLPPARPRSSGMRPAVPAPTDMRAPSALEAQGFGDALALELEGPLVSIAPALLADQPLRPASLPPPKSNSADQIVRATPDGAVAPAVAASHASPMAINAPATVKQKLLPGALLVAGAILVTLSDLAYSAISGEVFRIGPVRTSVLAGFVMLVGIVLSVVRMKPGR